MSDDRPATEVPRQTLAMRLAERNCQRERRAARLARLRAAELAPGRGGGATEDEAALEDFLLALTGATTRRVPLSAGEVLPFQAAPAPMPEPAPACDLDRLPGVGPGLLLALRRAGIDRLADVAGLAPQELSDRLGPIGRLVPAETWITTARAAAAPA